jgi:heme-degrading monooxygenase HmoA
VKAWRTQTRHREGQVKGRAGIFAEYRLRVASVLRDYGLHERAEVPADSKALHGA